MASFSLLCDYVYACSNTRPKRSGQKRSEKDAATTTVALFERWCRDLPQPLPPRTGAIVFRLLFPELEIRRRYGMKEALLAQHLIKLLGLSTRPGTRGAGLLQWNCDEVDEEDPKSGCLGLEVQAILAANGHSSRSTLTLQIVDRLLDELATYSPFSQLEHLPPTPVRTQREIIRLLYRDLNPFEAAVMTQVILKDLHPLLYPLPALSSSTALLHYNSASFKVLEVSTAMRTWHWAMLPVYNVRANLDRAADIVEAIPRGRPRDLQLCRDILENVSTPQIGVPVEIPKAVKGQSCEAAIGNFAVGSTIYVETKYDGERMQIHVDLDKPFDQQIIIFSKSKRNSTLDRHQVLPVIRAALGLQADFQPWPQLLALRATASANGRLRRVIVEAEMVAYSERGECVAEFHTVGRLLGRPKGGGAWNQGPGSSSQATSQSTPSTSQTINAAMMQGKERSHLAVVFFDLLYLNGKSYLQEPYAARRATLENIVDRIEGFSMLAARMAIVIDDPVEAIERLSVRFAQCMEAREEGLFLKAADSEYNDLRKGNRWLKLKKDYIPGLGDTGSFCVVGGGWDKERGRELGVPPNTYTTWFIGLQSNRRECLQIPSTKPHYLVLFVTHSYNLQRRQLEHLNFVVKSKERCKLSHWLPKVWPYTMHFASGLSARPAFVLAQPAVFELYGAGWTKQGSSKYYELRWPRVVRYMFDRRPEEALSRDEVQAIAERSATTSIDDGRSEAESAWDSACEEFAAVAPIVAVTSPPTRSASSGAKRKADERRRALSQQTNWESHSREELRQQLPTPPPTSQPEMLIDLTPSVTAKRKRQASAPAEDATEALAMLDQLLAGEDDRPPVFWALERAHDPHRLRRRIKARRWRLTCADSVFAAAKLCYEPMRAGVIFVDGESKLASQCDELTSPIYIFNIAVLAANSSEDLARYLVTSL